MTRRARVRDSLVARVVRGWSSGPDDERKRSAVGASSGERGAPRAPEDWTPDEAARRVKQLETEGPRSHGPQKHEGQITGEQHRARALEGIDPVTGAKGDIPTASTSFTSPEAYAQADFAVRNTPEFQAKAATGAPTIRVESTSLETALGPGYLKHVEGQTAVGAAAGTTKSVNFAGGRVFALYDKTPTGYALRTMYPKGQ